MSIADAAIKHGYAGCTGDLRARSGLSLQDLEEIRMQHLKSMHALVKDVSGLADRSLPACLLQSFFSIEQGFEHRDRRIAKSLVHLES